MKVKYESIIRNIIYSIIYTFILCILIGCFSTSRISKYDTAELILSNQESITKTTNTSEELESILRSSSDRLTEIRAQGSSIEGRIEYIIYLFESYESEVNRLLTEIEYLRDKINSENEGNSSNAILNGNSNNLKDNIINSQD